MAEMGVPIELVDDVFAFAQKYLDDERRGRLPAGWTEAELTAFQHKKDGRPVPGSLNDDESIILPRSPVTAWKGEAENTIQYWMSNWIQEDLMVEYCRPVRRPDNSKIVLAIAGNHARASKFTCLLWRYHPWCPELHERGKMVARTPSFKLQEYLKTAVPGANLVSPAHSMFIPSATFPSKPTPTPDVDVTMIETQPPSASDASSAVADAPTEMNVDTIIPVKDPTRSMTTSIHAPADRVLDDISSNKPPIASASSALMEDLLSKPDPIDWKTWDAPSSSSALVFGEIPAGLVTTTMDEYTKMFDFERYDKASVALEGNSAADKVGPEPEHA
ncbi:hypothetical protein C8F04DRAFT_1256618 [Mycena alexandri]|uniref:Uncharacterized protein n=1 Tax=Mycena alexandri TaxID=1745969 RepID=A0AAD6T146_9AGAR|nr:hypothetical protein C8F04DRAFT_1256618 [Mycena alexandri]